MKMCNSTSGQLHISNKCVLSINESIFAVQEYAGDGIDWTKVEFIDNQECLNLIEKVSCSVPSYSSCLSSLWKGIV